MAVGECGRQPLFIDSFIKCIKYWLRLLRMNNDRLPKKSYDMLMYLDSESRHTWATTVNNALYKIGFGFAWVYQDVGNKIFFIDQVKLRLKDISIQ